MLRLNDELLVCCLQYALANQQDVSVVVASHRRFNALVRAPRAALDHVRVRVARPPAP